MQSIKKYLKNISKHKFEYKSITRNLIHNSINVLVALRKFTKTNFHKFPKLIVKHKKEVILAILVSITGLSIGFFGYKYIVTPKAPKVEKTSNKSAFLYKAENKAFSVFVGTKKDNKPEVRFAVGDSSINFVPASARENLAQPTLENNKIIFKDVYPDTDYIYQTIPDGIKEDIIVKKPNDIRNYPFYISYTNAVPKYITTTIYGTSFYDNNGKYLFHFTPPFAYDAKGAKTNKVSYSIKKNGQGQLYAILSIDPVWLSDSKRVYPITIDPTVVRNTSALFSTGTLNRITDEGSSYITSATGGTITYVNGYTIHTFTSDGTFTAGGAGNVEVLVVAGGGGGGGGLYHGGGGGAGGLIYSKSFAVTTSPISVTVGGGGAGGVNSARGSNGSNSVFSTLTATGGGGGSNYSTGAGLDGGSGGGAVYNYNTPGAGVAGQGYRGGYGVNNGINNASGGGGGAGAVGGDGNTSTGGVGGIGVPYDISGTQTYYAGGGGGSAYNGTGGAGGLGGGGAGSSGNGTSGTANTGGGGGGAERNGTTGGSGGSGIVIVRYPTGPTLTTTYQELPMDQYTVGLWHINESSDNSCSGGEDVCDVSGKGHHGTDSGGSTIVTGKLSNARRFDGSDRIYTTASTDFEFGTGDFTIEAWVNFEAVPTTYRHIIGNYNPGWIMATDGNGQMAFFDSANWRSPAINITTGWHHWAISRSGSNLNFYLDGIYRATVSGVTTNIAGSFDELQIGKNDEWTDYFQNYTIDEVRISKIARSPEEIKISAQRRPYGVYTSEAIDLTAVSSWNSLTWSESGVTTGDGETVASSSGLIAKWNFNETSGTTADNAEGTAALDGTLTNFASTSSQDQAAGTGWTANNKRWGAGALMFDGSNDYVNVNDSAALDLTTGLTIEAWINHSTSGVFDGILQKGSFSNSLGNYEIHITDANKIRFILNNDSTNASVTGNINIEPKKWYHVVATYDQTTMKVYVNGVLDNSKSYSTAINTDNNPLIIGSYYDTSSYIFGGVIDSVRLYSRAITASEILSNYNAGNVELQTRVGASSDPNDGTWEEWRPTTGETTIDTMDNPLDWATPSASLWSGVPIATSSSTVVKAEGNASLKIQTGTPKIDANTVALWHLDETGGTGAYLKDSTSNANNGTPTGTTVVNGQSGKARNLNGSSDYVSVGTGSSLNLTSAGTIEAWIKLNSYGGAWASILNKRSGSNNSGYTFELYNNTGGLQLQAPGGSCGYSISSTLLPLNKWVHVAATFSVGSNSSSAYVNGVYQGGGTCSSIVSSSDTAIIGKNIVATTVIDGSIDEVKVSNIARTAEEIAESYRAGRDHRISKTISSTDLSSSSKIPFYVATDRPGTYLEATIGESAYANYEPDVNTVGLWHLDEQSGSGAYIKDSSGNGNNGTPTGTTFTQGKIGKGRYFGGNSTSDTINAGSGSSIKPNSVTAEAWINPNVADAAFRGVITNRASASIASGYLISYGDAAGKIYFRTTTNCSSWGITLSSTTTLQANQWYHVVATYTNGTGELYINGVKEASGSTTGNICYDANSLRIGGESDAGTYKFSGLIDEVRISNSVRTADEIRQAYEIGTRTYQVTIDFGAKLDSGNLIADSNDKSFTVDATYYGLNSKGSNLYLGDKIIIKENYDGTEYLAQGTVNAITLSTGAVTVSAWDTGSTFPSGGFTANAAVFKWQREYFDITGSLSSHRDATTKITLRLTNGNEGRNIWLDDFKYVSSYLTNPATTGNITSSTGNRYFQYRVIETSNDYNVSPSVSAITLDYVSNSTPSTPSLDSPTDAAGSQSLTPSLKTTTTDADSDYLRYKILLCTNASMSVDCQTFDQTSSQTGWSGQDTETNTAYTSGTQATYTIQSALLPGTTYYWKTYAIDPAGVNVWSSTQTTPYSFTTNQKPNTPTLDSPTDTATSQPLTPVLKTTGTDSDSPADYLRYKILLCTNSGMTASCQTFDQTSSQTGWSGQDTETNTAYASGTQAVYTIQSALASETTYYWKSYAIDPGGANTWSSTQGSPYSFTTGISPSFPTLLQTEGLTNPTSITSQNPNFTAICSGGTVINKYRIQVSTDPTFTSTTWDSGSSGTAMTDCTTGTRSSNLAYGGTALSLDGTKYFWRIKFWDQSGIEGPFSNTTNLFVMASVNSFPAPSSCRINEVANDGSLTLVWNDNTTGETQFRIEKNTDDGGFAFLTNAAADATSNLDSSVSDGHTYQYRVRAEGATNSDYCTTATLSLQLGLFEAKGLNLKGLNFK